MLVSFAAYPEEEKNAWKNLSLLRTGMVPATILKIKQEVRLSSFIMTKKTLNFFFSL